MSEPASTPAATPPAPAVPRLTVEVRHTFSTEFSVDVSFQTVSRSVALFGPSGSGKSTVLRAIAGLLHPEHGVVRLGERVLLDRTAGIDLPPRRRGVGLVVQEGLLFPRLNVRQNLLFGAPRQGGRLDLERIATLLEIEHLLERMPRNLSGGERQRVALGRAVLSEPQVLLCDEPFSALDAKRRQRLVPFVARIRDVLDIPMVLVSHNVSEVLALANEVVILEEGKIVAHGTTHDMLEALAHDEASALNFWEGVAEADPEAPDDEEVARVRVGEATIYAPFAAGSQAQRVRLSVSPNHVALATPETEPGSERNRFTGEVSAVSPQAGMLRVTLDARVPVTALITPDTARELQIAVGTRLTARFKVNAVQVLSVSGRVKRSDVASGD